MIVNYLRSHGALVSVVAPYNHTKLNIVPPADGCRGYECVLSRGSAIGDPGTVQPRALGGIPGTTIRDLQADLRRAPGPHLSSEPGLSGLPGPAAAAVTGHGGPSASDLQFSD